MSVVDRRLLIRYRVLAFSTAILLIVVVFVGIPLQVAAGRPQVVNDVGTIHGVLYIAYLFVAFQLTRRLGVPKLQMGLVLLAGTVPFCAFVAERKLTKRYEAQVQADQLLPGGEQTVPGAEQSLAGAAQTVPGDRPHPSSQSRSRSVRRRWLSRRALLLHLEVAIIAPACVTAGWWQATRALAGNKFSWVYSVEWPVFAIIAVVGWWKLVHEDPEVYWARKHPPARSDDSAIGELAPTLARGQHIPVNRSVARLAMILAVLLTFEFVLGIGAMLTLPFGRPSGWLPAHGQAVYLSHAMVGLVVALAAAALLARVRNASRNEKMVGWFGFVGVAVAGGGGLLTEAQSIARFLGMALMFLGALIAGLGYLIPTLQSHPHETQEALEPEVSAR